MENRHWETISTSEGLLAYICLREDDINTSAQDHSNVIPREMLLCRWLAICCVCVRYLLRGRNLPEQVLDIHKIGSRNHITRTEVAMLVVVRLREIAVDFHEFGGWGSEIDADAA